MSPIRFGTDGWRAIIAEDFTFDNVERIALASADFWKASLPQQTRPTVVVGYDRRFLSAQFALRTAEVIAERGLDVTLTSGPTPTPALSYAVKARRAVGGVMITASHNPPMFNGFKLKGSYGGSADTAICAAVEEILDKQAVLPFSDPSLLVQTPGIAIENVTQRYYAAIKRLVDFKLIARSKLRFAHDALFGVGAGCFDTLLAGTSCQVTTLNPRLDPLFGGINPEPIEKNYRVSSAYLRRHPHDICLVTDGDADRIGAMDGHGQALSTHQIICLILQHLVVNRQGRGRVIKALTTTSMVDKMCSEFGLSLIETGVGFKFIAAELMKGDYLLGAEESGGIAFPGHIPERDGILAGLVLLELLAIERTSVNRLIAKLAKKFGPHAYARIDSRFPVGLRKEFITFCGLNPPDKLLKSAVLDAKSFDGVKFIARDGSWLMFRGSGTEPILRIYAETRSRAGAQMLVKEGARMAGSWLKGRGASL